MNSEVVFGHEGLVVFLCLSFLATSEATRGISWYALVVWRYPSYPTSRDGERTNIEVSSFCGQEKGVSAFLYG